MESMPRGNWEFPAPLRLLAVWPIHWFLAASLLLSACAPKKQTTQEPPATAQEIFERTTKLYHLPSAEAQGAARDKLLAQAATGYTSLIKDYASQKFWAAQALRSLGNVRVAQGQTNEALKMFSAVATQYPEQDWEVLQAWKSAADLLWENQRNDESKTYYRRIVDRFDVAGAQPIVNTIVRGSKARLAGKSN